MFPSIFRLLPLSTFIVEVFGPGVNWCGQGYDCTVKGQTIKHSMCNPRAEGKNEKCISPKNLMNNKVENEILKLHNELRSAIESSVTPPFGLPNACKLRALEWDTVLADVATNWAMNCSLKLDPCCKIKKQGTVWLVKQNMLIMRRDIHSRSMFHNTIKTAVGFWFKMLATADVAREALMKLVQRYRTGAWDSAAQMLWSATQKIGCGYSSWMSGETSDYELLVCNYGPVGLWEGAEMYSICQKPASPQDIKPEVFEKAEETDGDIIILDSNGDAQYPLKLNVDDALSTSNQMKLGLVYFLQPPLTVLIRKLIINPP